MFKCWKKIYPLKRAADNHMMSVPCD
uniref:Uncharacterized protein n=1 Tax=Lepeophtheirus salmonis TaxID=72036 RepID=A0A0K2V0J9_LEPSM